jgi:TetR/AcrR family tetracycline transcriptional repressor
LVRPKTPLISRRSALEAALEIIDTEGIDALSIRRLAEQLSVNGASLYHHFENKEDILMGAAELALEGVRAPQFEGEPWRVWMLRNVKQLRRAFREHPDLVPVMLRHEPLGLGTAELEATAARLEVEGVPVGAIAPILEALELFTVGNALHESRTDHLAARDPELIEATPHLDLALVRRAISADEIFDKVCGQIMDTMVATAAERAASAPKRAAGRKRSARASFPGGLRSARASM